MKKILTLLLCLSVMLTACGGSVPGSEKLNVKSEEIQFAQPQPGDTVAEINTDAGVIKVLLFPEIAPKAVNNFIMLAQNGYYNGITFHRAIEDMLIQSGSFDGSWSLKMNSLTSCITTTAHCLWQTTGRIQTAASSSL